MAVYRAGLHAVLQIMRRVFAGDNVFLSGPHGPACNFACYAITPDAKQPDGTRGHAAFGFK